MSSELISFDGKILLELQRTPMPFGRYQGTSILNLPERYLVWFHRKGFPKGPLGQLMALALEIKTNGLESLVDEAISRDGKRHQ